VDDRGEIDVRPLLIVVGIVAVWLAGWITLLSTL
jgi:hypothetical protein